MVCGVILLEDVLLTEGDFESPLVFNIDKAGKYASRNHLSNNEAL